jgi:arginine-tRNA-protein transferase
MGYKTGFRPLERLGRDGWRRMDEAEAELRENDPLVLPTRRARRRLLIDA